MINELEYIKKHCKKCLNKDSELCCIRMRLDGSYNCLYYKKDKLHIRIIKKLKRAFKSERSTDIYGRKFN